MREAGERIAMLTCYDASFSALLDRAGVDVMLIGDSLGNVLQGHSTTLPVTLADIAYHTASVARGSKGALIVADMPFGTLGSREDAYANAVELMRAGAQMVKIEGGEWLADTVRFLVERSIPVCGHVGLTPQSVHAFGGFKVQGKTDAAAIADAPRRARATGSGRATDRDRSGADAARARGDRTVRDSDDRHRRGDRLLGAGAGAARHAGDFSRQAAALREGFHEGQPSILAAVEAYVRAVKDGTFPGPEHTF